MPLALEITAFVAIFIVCYAAVYLFSVFALSRIFVPHLNKKIKLPEKLPGTMQETINRIRTASKDREEYLHNVYNHLTEKYRGVRGELWKDLSCLKLSLEEAWEREGFLACTLQNYIFIIFLVKGGHFRENEIEKAHRFYSFNIHQYIKVKIDHKWIPIDIWSHAYGLKIGDKPKLF